MTFESCPYMIRVTLGFGRRGIAVSLLYEDGIAGLETPCHWRL